MKSARSDSRLEPLACVGKRVVLEPLRDLAADEAAPLLVALTDDTEIPFLRRPTKRDEWALTDQQVNVLQVKTSWSVQRVRLTTLSSDREQLAALRSTAPEFAPGTSGVVVVVLDGSVLSAYLRRGSARVRATSEAA